jgi:hypothetical protein
MTRVRIACFAFLLPLLASAQTVEQVLPAQPVAPSPGAPAAAPTEAEPKREGPRSMTLEEQRRAVRAQLGIVEPKKATPSGPNSVKLFDTANATPGLELRFGLTSFRRADEKALGYQTGGLDFQIARTTSSQAGVFFLNGVQATHLRVLDSNRSFLWSILSQQLASGVTLGPLELEGRFGFGFLNIDRLRGDGWNFSVLSPIVGVNAGLRIWRIRADVGIQSEFYWRWFGPNVLMHTLTFGLRFESKFSSLDLMDPNAKKPDDAKPAAK